jgi:putative ABC transport system permease protein
MLRGRHLDPADPVQAIVPGEVVGRLVERLFRIGTLLDAVAGIVGLAALAEIGLAVFLSYRLRAREMATAFKIGARRGTILRLLVSETAIILGLAVGLALGLAFVIQSQGEAIVAWLTTA